jgi:hypothetical protein
MQRWAAIGSVDRIAVLQERATIAPVVFTDLKQFLDFVGTVGKTNLWRSMYYFGPVNICRGWGTIGRVGVGSIDTTEVWWVMDGTIPANTADLWGG